MRRFLGCWFVLLACAALHAQWRVAAPHDGRQAAPPGDMAGAVAVAPGDPWPQDEKFRWMRAELEVPREVDDRATAGQPIGMRIQAGDGGEAWVDGVLQSRFDNDRPALVMIQEHAVPGTRVRVDIQVYGKVQGGDRFGEARWELLDPRRARENAVLRVHAGSDEGAVPRGIVGLSQGGGLADYDDATAAALAKGGFRWFRMDNIFTQVVREKDGVLEYDWTDFDRRVDFIAGAMGADPILAVSYMPIPFDAVVNHDRQSAPRDYALWEDLCYRAAARCIARGRRVPFWEVWNEVNTGWLKPGPDDTGAPRFRAIYRKARGRDDMDEEAVRRFEAYCKLYQATVRGVRRADPSAKIGGPALASGPFEHEERGHCFHGKGFARGLMFFCEEEGLPLDFLSWHEYFQPYEVFIDEVRAFREYLRDVPSVARGVTSYMVTEWNQAWWADRPHDHEIGAAWCANTITRAFIPHGIDRPCFFYVKQNDDRFRGDFSLLMRDNVPKAAFNVLSIFNSLAGRYLRVEGGDDELSAVAAWDAAGGRLALVAVNYRDRHNLRRKVELRIDALPPELRNGTWTESMVDATHANVWHDLRRATLEPTARGAVDGDAFSLHRTLQANSVTCIEILAAAR